MQRLSPGRNKVSLSPLGGGENLPSLSGLENSHSGPVHPRGLQLGGRQSVKIKISSGLAPFSLCDGTDLPEVGSPLHRPLCLQGLSSCAQVCFLDSSGPGGLLHRRLLGRLGFSPCLGVSPSSHDPSCAPALEPGQGPIHNNRPTLGEGLLETGPGLSSPVQSLCHPRSSQSPDGHVNGEASSSGGSTSFGGMVGAGWLEETSSWDPADRQLLLASWRKSTWKTYKAPWKRWLSWSSANGVMSNNPSPGDLAQYLCFLHRVQKLAYRSILVHKSVVCSLANPGNAVSLSSHPLVSHTLKGIFSASPKPPTRHIWSVNTLIDWIRANPPSPSSHFQVSRHVAILLLLSSGRRVHDLTLLSLDPDHFQELDDFVVFWPVFGSKTDSSSHLQSGWKIKENSSDPLFCIPTWIRHLSTLSQRRMGSRPLTSLFITTRGIVQPASRSVIAGWVKTALRGANIIASPGSMRSAVATFRYNSDLPLDSILRQGNWRGGQNFFKYYYRACPVPRSAPLPSALGSFEPIS